MNKIDTGYKRGTWEFTLTFLEWRTHSTEFPLVSATSDSVYLQVHLNGHVVFQILVIPTLNLASAWIDTFSLKHTSK